MAFTKITEEDMRGKGNVGRPDTPGVSTAEMQRILDELPREVVVPAFNRLINELGLTTAAGNIGAKNGTVQAHIDSKTNPHGVTAGQVGSYTKQEVTHLIDQKIVDLGAGDMSKGEFADGPGKVKDSTKLDGKTADQCAILEYKHTRVGNVHNFTGSGLNGKVKMSENVQPGDTVQLNGVAATAYVGAEDFTGALAGEAIAGKWLTFTREGNALNFKGGGGKVTTTNLTAANIRKGVTVTVKQGSKVVATVLGAYEPQLIYSEQDGNQYAGVGDQTRSLTFTASAAGTYLYAAAGWLFHPDREYHGERIALTAAGQEVTPKTITDHYGVWHGITKGDIVHLAAGQTIVLTDTIHGDNLAQHHIALNVWKL